MLPSQIPVANYAMKKNVAILFVNKNNQKWPDARNTKEPI